MPTDAEIDDTPEEGQQQEQLTRTSIVPRPSNKYSPHEYLLLTDGGEPSCYCANLGVFRCPKKLRV